MLSLMCSALYILLLCVINFVYNVETLLTDHQADKS